MKKKEILMFLNIFPVQNKTWYFPQNSIKWEYQDDFFLANCSFNLRLLRVGAWYEKKRMGKKKHRKCHEKNQNVYLKYRYIKRWKIHHLIYENINFSNLCPREKRNGKRRVGTYKKGHKSNLVNLNFSSRHLY